MTEGAINKWRVLFGLIMGLFMASIEGTIVPIAMPRAVLELGGQVLYNWPITIFILSSTVSIPVWGRVSDIWGRRPVYLTGLTLFAVSSLLCGTSWNMESLILFRLLQGLGSGALFSLTFTIIGDLFTLEERGRVTSYTTTVWAVGSVLGPPLGGVIVDLLGWRWVYFINIPPAMVAFWIGFTNITSPLRGGLQRSLDIKGLVLFTLIATSAIVLIDAPLLDWHLILFTAAILVAALPAFIVVELREQVPFVPFNLFSNKLNLAIFILNGLLGFAFFGTITVIPPILQWFYGLPPTEAGLLLAPATIGWVVAANISSRLVVRHSPAPLIRIGVLLFVASIFLLLVANNILVNPIALIIPLVLMGSSMGLTVPTTLIAVQTLSSPSELGFMTSILTFFRSLGGSVGTQAMWAPFTKAPIELKVLETIYYPSILSFGSALALLLLNAPLAFILKWPNLQQAEMQRRQAYRG
ncbi:MAG: MFS transporter [Nitrososphaerota archaeon]